ALQKDYDFIPRAFNFLLFFGILFYLIKDYVKKAYVSRIERIANSLEDIEVKLRESKEKRAKAQKDVEIAKIRGENLIDVSKKEIISAKKRSKENIKNEFASLEKAYEGKKEFESTQATKEVVNDILSQTLDDESVTLTQDELVKIISKKAS
ncbi:MAG: F0F1 ATP synthase subunit B, partial [Campylobacter sp.]|nr:F0F1 ATP synthase subunit B [Campylobacter sp.]